MTDSPRTQTPAAAHIAAGVPFLPGRTVELAVHPYANDGRGIVVAVDLDGQECTVKFGKGPLRALDFRTLPARHLRAINPDRLFLSHDDFVVGALAEKIAARSGQLEGFHKGHNNGRTTFTEIARSWLADVDIRSFGLKHGRCTYRFVETPDGVRRDSPTDYEPGDRLVECTFYVDGPGTFYCGVHRPIVDAGGRACIFHAGATETERQASRDRGELVHRAPIVAPGAPAEPAELVLTEVEQSAHDTDRLIDIVRAALIADARENGATRTSPGTPRHDLRSLVAARVAELDNPPNLSLYGDALSHGVRRGLLVSHEGHRYSPAPDYLAHDAA